MRLVVESWGLKIVPENAQDQAYIRDTLGLERDGDGAIVLRRDRYLCGEAAYLETKKRKDEKADSNLEENLAEDGL